MEITHFEIECKSTILIKSLNEKQLTVKRRKNSNKL